MDRSAQHLAVAADTVSALAIAGVFMGWLPDLAALAAFAWYLMQLYESKTFQAWVAKRRRRRALRRHKAH